MILRLRVLRIYTRHTSLRAASHRAVGYVHNQNPINAMNPICLNSSRIKPAQSRHEKIGWNSLYIGRIAR